MKKNRYGNIEDMVENVRIVTPLGTIEKSCTVPRMSMGPDFTQMILGSEGMLGVITEVHLKLRRLPQVQIYDSVVFPTFEDGISALHEIAQQNCAPASIRLMDNVQFQLGQALKPRSGRPFQSAVSDVLKKAYLQYKQFRPDRLCGATLLFEGSAKTVQLQQEKVFSIVKAHGGILAGAENGHRGYFLTYVIGTCHRPTLTLR